MPVQLLRDHADDPQFQEQWREVKAVAKKKCAARIESLTGVKVKPDALFDVQVRCGCLCSAEGGMRCFLYMLSCCIYWMGLQGGNIQRTCQVPAGRAHRCGVEGELLCFLCIPCCLSVALPDCNI